MASHGEGHVVGYTPADTNQGWGVAAFICLLTAALVVMAFVVHARTYHEPSDPRSPSMARQEAGGDATEITHGAAAEHGPAVRE